MRIRRNDTVVLRKAVTGVKDTSGGPLGNEAKGSRGRVLKVLKGAGKLIIEGINYKYEHVRPSQKNPQGGRIAKEGPVDISNVMLYCANCDKGVTVRIERVATNPESGKGPHNIVRYCKECGQEIAAPK